MIADILLAYQVLVSMGVMAAMWGLLHVAELSGERVRSSRLRRRP